MLLSRLYLGAQGPAQGDMPFLFGAREGVAAGVAMQSLSRHSMALRAQCDGAARLRVAPWGNEPAGAETDGPARDVVPMPEWAAPDTPLRAVLGPRARDRLVLDLGPEVTRCSLDVQTGGDESYTVSLERDENARRWLAANADPDAQRQPATRSGDALADVFHAERSLAMTAALPAANLRLLPDGTDALNARIEALTGSRVPAALLAEGDPDLPLDFSNAPQLDAIYLSYLYMAADYSGALIARMLAWHAERGTEVRILVSDTLYAGSERRYFEDLAARYPRIQIQPFRFAAQRGDGLEEHMARFHRSNHAKLFLTLARDPARSRVILGGRNWHDSYLFRESMDLSAHPDLRQYDSQPLWSWLDFRPFLDIEVEFSGHDLATSIAGQFLVLWHHDHAASRPFDWPPPVPAATAGRGQARHFLSVPWVDEAAQIDFFVDLIDASRERIDIASPFVNLTPEIHEALDRAVARGVSVRVVTTIAREGLDGVYLNFVQSEFVRDWVDRVSLHSFSRGEKTLHSKIFVFDQRLSVITATNLNQRSFYHDLENGLVVLDRQFGARAVAIIDEYIRRARRVQTSEGGEVPQGPAAALLRESWLRRLF